jgi:hypothetical protein
VVALVGVKMDDGSWDNGRKIEEPFESTETRFFVFFIKVNPIMKHFTAKKKTKAAESVVIVTRQEDKIVGKPHH